ncbi:hypothetical protein E3N88_38382 [Mikania micrantha]|uniref:Uncharacterized protein n=1 Tax=Mikania micrantha TaxID=192012 RepID=A0A5N6LUN6_9ASTR|nr:hypothetical protein E3N88_38382 [Mikania micrantha]
MKVKQKGRQAVADREKNVAARRRPKEADSDQQRGRKRPTRRRRTGVKKTAAGSELRPRKKERDLRLEESLDRRPEGVTGDRMIT